MADTDNTADIIDVRDIIARYENLVASIEYCEENSEVDADELAESLMLRSLLDDLRGNGGDEQWQGDWYPITLIRDSYFTEYAQELAEDIGAIDSEARWPAYCIDWEWASRELRMDYTSVDYDGIDYWYR